MRMRLSREQRVADRYLRSFDMVADRLQSAVTGLERAESALASMTAAYEAFGGSGSVGNDKILNALCNVERACDEMERYSALLQDEFARVEALLSEVQRLDADAGKALRLAYIERESASGAAEALECPRRRVYELLRLGLDLAFDLLAGDGSDEDR